MIVLILLVAALPAFSGNAGSSGAPAGPVVEASQYVGSDTCKTCHEELYTKNFETTPHFKTTRKDGHGCESCHGPGAEHVAGGGDVSKIVRFKNLSRPQASARCLTCHGIAKGKLISHSPLTPATMSAAWTAILRTMPKKRIVCWRRVSPSCAMGVTPRPRPILRSHSIIA